MAKSRYNEGLNALYLGVLGTPTRRRTSSARLVLHAVAVVGLDYSLWRCECSLAESWTGWTSWRTASKYLKFYALSHMLTGAPSLYSIVVGQPDLTAYVTCCSTHPLNLLSSCSSSLSSYCSSFSFTRYKCSCWRPNLAACEEKT